MQTLLRSLLHDAGGLLTAAECSLAGAPPPARAPVHALSELLAYCRDVLVGDPDRAIQPTAVPWSSVGQRVARILARATGSSACDLRIAADGPVLCHEATFARAIAAALLAMGRPALRPPGVTIHCAIRRGRAIGFFALTGTHRAASGFYHATGRAHAEAIVARAGGRIRCWPAADAARVAVSLPTAAP